MRHERDVFIDAELPWRHAHCHAPNQPSRRRVGALADAHAAVEMSVVAPDTTGSLPTCAASGSNQAGGAKTLRP